MCLEAHRVTKFAEALCCMFRPSVAVRLAVVCCVLCFICIIMQNNKKSYNKQDKSSFDRILNSELIYTFNSYTVNFSALKDRA